MKFIVFTVPWKITGNFQFPPPGRDRTQKTALGGGELSRTKKREQNGKLKAKAR